jgi:hypothetical protein
VTGAEEDCIFYKLAEGDCTVLNLQKEAAIDDWCIKVLLAGGRRF